MPTSILLRADQVIEEACLLQRMSLFLADFVEEVGGPNVWDVARNQGAREFVCSQAGIGAGSGISFASFRRFWAVAASRNSS
jgi:hypothetical protein